MISKIEFIASTEIAEVSPTVLGTYTTIYDPKFSDEENNSPVGYFIQSPRTLSFELDVDNFLIDDVYDSSNDRATENNPNNNVNPKFQYFCNKVIKVYENDVFTYSGILLPEDMSYSEDKSKFSFKFSDPLIIVTNAQSSQFVKIEDIALALDFAFQNMFYEFLGTIVDPLIPLVQDYTPKGTAYFPNIEIDKYRATP